ncbi:hypothetical protein RHGRI_023865 [Rhododendron griersonianum]|uniref:Ribosomal protein L2 n=1 Tax=Rhododendron griersonianum TaxID=479676 RepID=A0AAV6JCD1_9ERIC|nr:hypothetical protein RHGRI_023865 [Rhododendron griersonianum]
MSRPRFRARCFQTSSSAYNGRGRGTTGQSGSGNRFAILNASPPQLLFAVNFHRHHVCGYATEKTIS